jgi:hypothetical protein
MIRVPHDGDNLTNSDALQQTLRSRVATGAMWMSSGASARIAQERHIAIVKPLLNFNFDLDLRLRVPSSLISKFRGSTSLSL